MIEAADRLTRVHGLEVWSTRQLLAEVTTSFSVIYRLVGDREMLSAAVVDRAVAAIPCPSADLPWRDWLTELLLAVRVRCLEYPGMAHWLLTRGGTIPSVMPILETGLDVLARAGFDEEATAAYTFVFTSTVTLTALSDARRSDMSSALSSITHAAMLDRLEAVAGSRERVDAMKEFVRELGGDDAARALQAHYEYTLARALDGLERRLERRTHGGA